MALQAAGKPFGTVFTPAMLTASYAPQDGWGGAVLQPRGALRLDPATMALHYGQTAFEGLMAYRQPDGRLAFFRARDYASRLIHSCSRMAIPPILETHSIELWRQFARHELPHLPESSDFALYLRPLVFGCDAAFGDRPSTCYQLLVQGVVVDLAERARQRPLEVLITDQFVRAAPSGVGAAKVPGNYGAAMLARQAARDAGCDQVLWLDAGRRRWVEELGSMNVAFVISEVLVTPPLTDTILAGVTRQTVLTLAAEAGLEFEERPIALEEITAAMSWKGLTEAIGCGTAAGLVSIGAFHIGERRLSLPAATPVADRLRGLLRDHQGGRIEDSRGWLTAV
ncbi:MAG: branched-chain amino acid aminotransferase [Fimbriimonadaceae bacterium]|nr:branched-chain amino acid aminotransferase [Fimbriimonadaceae bacterium]